MFPNDFFGNWIPGPDEFPQEFGLARVFKLLTTRYRPVKRLQRRRVISIVWKDADRGEEAVDEFDAATVMQQIDPDTGHVDDRYIDETRPRAEGHGLPAVPAGPGRIDHLWPRIPIGLLNKTRPSGLNVDARGPVHKGKVLGRNQFARPAVEDVEKAGNPHVQFDERGWETGRCHMAQATAPILDSTGGVSLSWSRWPRRASRRRVR